MKEADYTELKEVLRFLVYSVGTIAEGKRKGGKKSNDRSRCTVSTWRDDYEVKPVEFLGEQIASIGLINDRLLRCTSV